MQPRKNRRRVAKDLAWAVCFLLKSYRLRVFNNSALTVFVGQIWQAGQQYDGKQDGCCSVALPHAQSGPEKLQRA